MLHAVDRLLCSLTPFGALRCAEACRLQMPAGTHPADFKLADDGVKLMTKADRSGERVNTGIAFVRFKDADEAALAAAAQHRKMMGTRYIECIPYTAPPVRLSLALSATGHVCGSSAWYLSATAWASHQGMMTWLLSHCCTCSGSREGGSRGRR